jgi:hypothetical protein
LWAHGCYVWRQNTGAYKPEGTNRYIRYGTPGCADIIGLNSHGRFLAIECKAGKNTLSEQQEIFGERITEHNGIYIVAYSVEDLELQKEQILAKQYPPMLADGALRDHRVKSTGKSPSLLMGDV